MQNGGSKKNCLNRKGKRWSDAYVKQLAMAVTRDDVREENMAMLSACDLKEAKKKIYKNNNDDSDDGDTNNNNKNNSKDFDNENNDTKKKNNHETRTKISFAVIIGSRFDRKGYVQKCKCNIASWGLMKLATNKIQSTLRIYIFFKNPLLISA